VYCTLKGGARVVDTQHMRYVCIYIHMFMYIHKHIYIYVYTNIHMYMYNVCTLIYVQRVYMCTCMYVSV